jgi:putative FmdB family regulatory protein
MPTYGYLCKNCDHEFELMQKMTDPVKRKCPKCKKMKLNRLIGSCAGVIFKGDGFYCNDYSHSKKKAEKQPVVNNKKWKKGPAKKLSD